MKHRNVKSANNLHLHTPNLIEPKASFSMQFVFYFLFLILGICGVYGCFYTTFTLPLELKPLIFYAAAFCAVFTIVSLIKTRYALLLFVLVGSAAVIFVKQDSANRFISYLTQGYILTYNSMVSAYAEKVQYNLYTFPVAANDAMEITAYITAFAVFTLFFFTSFLAWLLVRRKNTAVSFVLTAPFFILSAVVGKVPHYLAVGALYLFWGFLLLNSSFMHKKSKFNQKKGMFYSGGKNSATLQAIVLLPVLAACLMLVTAIFPINGFTRSDLVKNMRIRLLNVPEMQSPFQIPVQSIFGYSGRVNLQLVGNIEFTGKTVLRVKSSNKETDYLKGYVGSRYTGQSWDSLPEKEYEKLDSILNEWKVQNFSSLFNKLLGRSTKTYELTVQNSKKNLLRVYAPYGLISMPDELDGINFIQDGYLRSASSLLGTKEYSMNATTLHIDAWKMSESMMNAFVSEQSSFIHAALRYNDFVYSHYTQLPSGLKEMLDRYLQEHNLNIENYLTLNAFANAIITQVQNENSYTLSPGYTPEGRDFVEYFLFENHKGYCVHFASATAALLRAAGIPARYVEGYVVSQEDFDVDGEWANIADSRSHAWVEIYLAAVGWVPVEATPGSNSGIIDHEEAELKSNDSINLEEDALNDKFYNHEAPQGENLPVEADESSSTEIQSSSIGYIVDYIIRLLPILAASGLFISALLISRKLQIALRKKQFAQNDSNESAIVVYNYILKLNAYGKSNKAAEWKVPNDIYDLVLKARFSQHNITEQELDILISYAESQALDIQKTVSMFKRFLGKYVYVLF